MNKSFPTVENCGISILEVELGISSNGIHGYFPLFTFFVLGATAGGAQGLLLVLLSESVLVDSGDHIGMSGTESYWATCKANGLPTVVLLQPIIPLILALQLEIPSGRVQGTIQILG